MCAPAVLGTYVVATCKVGMWYPFSRDPFVADHYVFDRWSAPPHVRKHAHKYS